MMKNKYSHFYQSTDKFKRHHQTQSWESCNCYENPFKLYIEDNILTIDLPGYEKEDLKLTQKDNFIDIYLKDDDVTNYYQIPSNLKIESACCKAGQLIIKFIEKDEGTEIQID